MTREAPSNTDDVIDSRDVIARIEELKAIADAAAEDEDAPKLDEDEQAELAALKELELEASGYAADWEHGETLIRDSYFETYAQELAEDIGAIDRNANWPLGCIDWKQAADELKVDYTSVDFAGVTYWVR